MVKSAFELARDRARSAQPPRSFIAVDWSGARVDARKHLWLAEARDGHLVRLECGRDRAELVRHLIECAAREPRLVVGLDFAFSFPRWFLDHHGVASARELWSLVARDGEKWLAECPRPFWGRPGVPRPPLAAGRSEWRKTESEVARVQGIGPKTIFQIGGAGSVGTGSLRGMPCLEQLRNAGFAIWPFDRARLPLVVEIYPRYLTGPVNKSNRIARALYVQAHLANETRALQELATGSEDAFDAAVSAARMQRFACDFVHLDRARSRRDVREGSIWRPLSDPTFERW